MIDVIIPNIVISSTWFIFTIAPFIVLFLAGIVMYHYQGNPLLLILLGLIGLAFVLAMLFKDGSPIQLINISVGKP